MVGDLTELSGPFAEVREVVETYRHHKIVLADWTDIFSVAIEALQAPVGEDEFPIPTSWPTGRGSVHYGSSRDVSGSGGSSVCAASTSSNRAVNSQGVPNIPP